MGQRLDLQKSYWIGPYGVRVPMNIKEVYEADGYNKIGRDGGCTLMGVLNPMSPEQWLENYAEKKEDGYYWYTGKKK